MTGIAVFAYKRPIHLTRVLGGLRENGVDHVYVFSDGPATKADRPAVRAVRDVISGIDWCDTTTVFREENLGLARSIIRGVDRVFEDNDRVIVLEDDCVPAPTFLDYMTACFEEYDDEPRVMSVSGYAPPIEIPDQYPDDVYFTHRNSSWGWGTWQQAWEAFDYEPLTIEDLQARESEIKRLTRKAGRDLFPMMRRHLEGKIDSWAVWWEWAILQSGGLSVSPTRSRIQNIGFDETATHTTTGSKHAVEIATDQDGPLQFPDEIAVDERINDRYTEFISGGRRHRVKRLLATVLKRLRLFWLYTCFRDR